MISVCILTKNSAATLGKTLDSVASFPEVLIYDNGSTDETLSIAAQYTNVVIHEGPFIGFGPLRNRAAELARYDWILALDSDEVISPKLLHEIQEANLEARCVYNLPRHNFYNGKRIWGCGWGGDRVVRLYNRKSTLYRLDAVHESVVTNGLQIVCLKYPLIHTPFRSTSEFLAKMQHYSSLYAQQNQGRKVSFSRAVMSGLYSFFRSYFLQKGFLLGREGFIISLYNANTTFYKYLKLSER